jgi:5-methylcytosine-specific restriction endonuclease McrA
MVSCCKPCNSKKGNRSQGVFLETMRTPPVFPERPSPTRSRLPKTSPFQSENNPD